MKHECMRRFISRLMGLVEVNELKRKCNLLYQNILNSIESYFQLIQYC